jgi:hypothetical protein
MELLQEIFLRRQATVRRRIDFIDFSELVMLANAACRAADMGDPPSLNWIVAGTLPATTATPVGTPNSWSENVSLPSANLSSIVLTETESVVAPPGVNVTYPVFAT